MSWADVRVRPFSNGDVDDMVNYLFRGPRDLPFFQQMDYSKFPNEAEYRSQLHNVASTFARSPWVAVEVKGRVVGVHLLSNYSDGSADFHAHIWAADMRGKGLGMISWFKACAYFFDSLKSLHCLYFRFPKENTMAKGLARKLPLTLIGEQPMRGPFAKEGLMGVTYKVDRSDFQNLQSQESSEVDESDL